MQITFSAAESEEVEYLPVPTATIHRPLYLGEKCT